jgi:hypothetical protein
VHRNKHKAVDTMRSGQYIRLSVPVFENYNSPMHFFHSRLPSTQSLQSALEPRSEWAKIHAAEFAQMGVNITTISDSRTCVIEFSALQSAVEAAMGQACIAIEWVGEGGGNQVCCHAPPRLSLRSKLITKSSST